MKFTKMHGLGNDFVVINTLQNPQSLEDLSQGNINNLSIKQLSHRHLGIGFDQLLLIGPSTRANFSCRIFNSDGSEAEQCGNGMRCVARYIHEEKLFPKNTINIETKAGIVQATVRDYDHIQVSMGIPIIENNIPNLSVILTPETEPRPLGSVMAISITLPNGRGSVSEARMTVLSLGNPHIILQVPSLENFPVKELGQQISTHPHFPNGINVGFMEIVNRQHIRLCTYERGTGMTLACGSNACAAVAAGIHHQLLDTSVKVELVLGNLIIEWQSNQHPLLMTGPASRMFDGNIYLQGERPPKSP